MNLALDRKFPGIQLALFELIWPSFEWVRAVYIRCDADSCMVHVQADGEPALEDVADCGRMLNEIFDAALAGSALRIKVIQASDPPETAGYQEAISDEIFKMIATDVAPWRLAAGR